MSSSQLTVSAIRQHFEAINYLETTDRPTRSSAGNKHAAAAASKPGCDAVTSKKQPPKTRPKPKLAVVVVGRCVDAVKFAGDVSTANQSRRQCCTRHDECTGQVRISSGGASWSDPSLDKTCMQQPPVRQDIVRPTSVRQNDVPITRWASASSLLSDVAPAYTDDVKQAIKKAKQKAVLHRIVGMKLEAETLPHDTYKSHIADTHGEMNDVDALLPCVPTADDTKISPVSTDTNLHAASLSTSDDQSTSTAVVPQSILLLDRPTHALIKRSNSSPVSETFPADRTTIASEHSGSSEDVKTAVQSRRPTSLYPEDIDDRRQPSPADTRSPTSATDAAPQMSPAAGSSSVNLRLRLKRNPVTGNHSQAATSRQSYLVLEEYVSENFSFLDDIDDDDTELSGETADSCDGGELTLATLPSTSIDQATDLQATSSTTAADQCTQRRYNDEAQMEEMPTSERPKSLIRRSIVLSNGEILEIIGDTFTFLDDYGEQTEDSCIWTDYSYAE